jgi:hypothetical protein
MKSQIEISQKAKSIPLKSRKNILRSFKETEIHDYIKILFEKMESDYHVEITHGPNELGKDLVIVKKDAFSTDVIGVIVKKGDIKGTTVGEVDKLKDKINVEFKNKSKKRLDEIESQIKQSISHPAELKEIFKSLPITKCFVILIGEFSKQAKERINKEINNVYIELFDINWLVKNFTENYPQIFFQGQILDFVMDKIKELEKKHWLTQKNLNLSDYYIEPWVKKSKEPFKLGKNSSIKKEKEKKFIITGISSILKKDSRIILTGEPGSGKSMALAKIGIDALKKASVLKQISKDRKEKTEIPLCFGIRQS